MYHNKHPLVSVVMPVYNRETFVGEAIESVLNQTYPHFEFIIVDDGSTDNTPVILQEYADKDSRIRIITHDKNCGIGCARNTAQQNAKGKYLSIMDSDDVMVASRLYRQVKAMEENPHITALGGILVGLEKGYNPSWDENSDEYQLVRYGADFPVSLFFANIYGNAAVMVRRSFIEQHQIMYDATLNVGEDYDYWMKVIVKNGILMKLNHPLLLLRTHSGRSTMNTKDVISGTNAVRQKYFTLFGQKVENKMDYSLKEQCDILGNIVAYNDQHHIVDHNRLSQAYDAKCLPNEPNKLWVSHRFWQDIFVLQDDNRFVRKSISDGGTYTINGDFLVVKWDRWPEETFRYNAKTQIYEEWHANKKQLSHPYWTDYLVIENNRGCRSKKASECGQIIKNTDNKVMIKWDKYGTELFVLDPESLVYRFQRQ